MKASLLMLVLSGIAVPAAAQSPSCRDLPAYHQLDFWIGEWKVLVGGQQVGTNRIESVLDGCAVFEHWRDGRGREGKSLFYYSAEHRRWQQVWVTAIPGGIKEKAAVEGAPPGGIRLQGLVRQVDGSTVLDRTTLTPLPEGQVRQHIEVSGDGGRTWRTTFDAVYVRQ